MSPELNRDPLYLQIAQKFRDQIISGELEEGRKLPTTRELMDQYSIAMGTSSKVLGQLQSWGLARAVKGDGTVVDTTGTYRTAMDLGLSAFRRDLVYQPNEMAVDFNITMVAAPPYVAEAMGLSAGAEVIRRQRVKVVQTTRRALSIPVSWFDGSLAESCPRLLKPERITEGTFAYIATQTGRQLDLKSKEGSMWADGATAGEAGVLGIELGSPVLRSESWFRDIEGAVLEYGESVTHPLHKARFRQIIDGEGNTTS